MKIFIFRMIFGDFPSLGMLVFVQNRQIVQMTHAPVRKISENHAKIENFDPKNISGNIELGDTQDVNFS